MSFHLDNKQLNNSTKENLFTKLTLSTWYISYSFPPFAQLIKTVTRHMFQTNHQRKSKRKIKDLFVVVQIKEFKLKNVAQLLFKLKQITLIEQDWISTNLLKELQKKWVNLREFRKAMRYRKKIQPSSSLGIGW